MATEAKTGEGAASSTAPGSTGTEPQTGTTKPGEQPGDQGGKTTGDQKTGAGEGQTTGEQKTEPKAGEKAEPEGKAGEPKTQPKAPEKYALQVPDAIKAYVDPSYLALVEKTARAGDMSNDEAQAFLEDQVAHVTTQANTWAEETKKHPTYGGDHLAESQKLAQRAIDRVFPAGHEMRDSFTNFLARGGAGNNINVVAFLTEVGRLMGEDSPAPGKSGSTPGGPNKAAQQASVMYDHPASKAADGRS